MSELLAKSKPKLSLVQHTQDVMDAGQWLFGTAEAPTRLGGEWARFFRLQPSQLGEFYLALQAAAAWHDVGKASSSFQDAIIHGKQQLLRHEHLSGLLLTTDAVQRWMDGRADLRPLKDIVLSAVLTHHLKLRDDDALAPRPADLTDFKVLSDHEDFTHLLRVIGARLRLPGDLPKIERFWTFEAGRAGFCLNPLREATRKRLRQIERELRRQPPERDRLNRAVRAALIAADAAASGLTRRGHRICAWLAQAFDESRLCDEGFIRREVIEKRVEEIRRANPGRPFKWNQFQDAAAELPERALLLEPCGAGKTLAAWRWIAARANERPVSRVLFLYPTRATATEGFRDYVSWAPGADAALMHGTAEYDLDGMFETPAEDPSNRDERAAKLYEVEAKLFALGFWTKRVFSATVDQFLAFMQYAYGPVCMLPVLADSVVLIDEVHSFDHSMFSALKGFLSNFDVPVLCMTATLPQERKDQLLACGLRPPEGERPEDLRKAADAPRYRVRRLANAGEAEERALSALGEGRRVLWVVNQVRRAQEKIAALRLRLSQGARLLCYHSRFRLKDRRGRHEEVIDAFQAEDAGPVLALTTQVCEMSLDLDADVLVTEKCPITSLIQRMGRSNRKAIRPWGGEVLVYEPENRRPYDQEALEGLDAFLNAIATGADLLDLSQSRLEAALLKYGPKLGRVDRWCSFLESGPFACGEETFRDIEEFTVPAVLAGDVAAFLRLQKAGQPTAGLIVPVPKGILRGRERDRRLPSFLAVAPDEHYDPQTGFWNMPIRSVGGAS
jgi:CRISPR-associated endonuclease/helicase Cas3